MSISVVPDFLDKTGTSMVRGTKGLGIGLVQLSICSMSGSLSGNRLLLVGQRENIVNKWRKILPLSCCQLNQ